ncbi:MAG: threonylcarbamoyl-AMP synthase [Christensenellaceae bacterium]|jgi:L-threonylcarbamoyladenylate synthase|nr:threonylcarbamoyl-AMP synthase [Christensenellaceae bacterium]
MTSNIKPCKTIVGGIDKIEDAAFLIKSGRVVAFPTETVYGLGANAFDSQAVASIYEIKGRPQDNPFIVHIADVDDLDRVARCVPSAAIDLFESFSPGPLTIVLKKRHELPDVVTAGLDTVGIRIPAHIMARQLIKLAGVPIAAPSANISGRISPTSAMHVFEYFNGKIPLILDGGESQVGIESTVLDLTKSVPIILRPGSITLGDLKEVLGDVFDNSSIEQNKPESPGAKYRHYAPQCPAVCAKSIQSIIEIYDSNIDKCPVIIGAEHIKDKLGERAFLSLGQTSNDHARTLFSMLRRAEQHYQYIIVQYFDDDNATGIYAGLNNRIIKATR